MALADNGVTPKFFKKKGNNRGGEYNCFLGLERRLGVFWGGAICSPKGTGESELNLYSRGGKSGG